MFSNYMEAKVRNHYGRNYASIDIPFEKTKDLNASDIDKEEFRPYIKNIQEKIEDYWYEYNDEPNRFAAAEIASILKIAEEEPEEIFSVHLIATDTLQSVLAAELVAGWFGKHQTVNKQVEKVLFQRPPSGFDDQKHSDYVVKDLRVSNQDDYAKGVLNLLDVLNRITDRETILNITGGYKAIIPIITVWAQIKKKKIKYLFNENELENALEPLTLDTLPINFDWEFIESVAYALNEDVRKSFRDENRNDEQILNLLKKNKLINNNRELTPFGILIQQYLSADGQPTSNNILGLFVEYKLFEFFSTTEYQNIKYEPRKVLIYKNPDGTLTSERNEDNQNNGYCEIDLFLKKPDDTFLIGEVKSYNLVRDGIGNELEEKARKYEEFIPGNQPSELWLIIVSPCLKSSVGEWYDNPKDIKYKVLQRLRYKYGNKFRAFSYQFDLSSNKLAKGIAAVNTKTLLQKSIDPKELVEIDLPDYT